MAGAMRIDHFLKRDLICEVVVETFFVLLRLPAYADV